ncbi:SMI1/KNR4 family protein [Achromobacter spanius]|uniref:SMI1/KNR4 family protein n=1 Tax=Achromobacter spanius TaxID=217203 RepID=UPI003208B3DE
MATYAELADDCGIALPDALRQLIDAGLTGYGDIEAWRADWKGNTLAARPVLSCMDDLEWIDAGQARETAEEWLNPAYQHGRRFLPFAETGAGDAYCLTPTADGGIGVALVWHDSDDASIGWASFEAFAFDALVRSAADFTPLIEDGFSAAESAACVKANIQALKPGLPDAMQSALDRLLADVAPDTAAKPNALAGPDAVRAALALLPPAADESFAVVARWECGEP